VSSAQERGAEGKGGGRRAGGDGKAGALRRETLYQQHNRASNLPSSPALINARPLPLLKSNPIEFPSCRRRAPLSALQKACFRSRAKACAARMNPSWPNCWKPSLALKLGTR
jgi:hypothetical protein